MTGQRIPCQDCGKDFEPKHWYQRFCSALCRLRGHRKQKKLKNQPRSAK